MDEKQNSPVEKVEVSRQDERDGFSRSKVYPMAGALLGTCLGGPVGFLAGVKIGGLAAVGGSIFGRISFRKFVARMESFWQQNSPFLSVFIFAIFVVKTLKSGSF